LVIFFFKYHTVNAKNVNTDLICGPALITRVDTTGTVKPVLRGHLWGKEKVVF
jgi:hypothetical protein